jgi:DivIVA domain-containing protein
VDRDEIQRHDFPTGRRGYDPASVDEHLRRVADEFEGLRRPAPAPSLSGGTSEQVRQILEAAERGADELRARAGDEASAHVGRVREAADGLLGRLDELEAELARLLQGLRHSGERLARGLEELQAEASRAAGAAQPVEEDFAAAAPADRDEPPPADAEPSPPPALAAPELPSDDEAGARLIALNMALDGTPREEAARYLAEHFALADPDGLLDDVYSRAER